MSELSVLPPVAKSVSYPCKKCDAERYHRVLAHTTATSAKIECEICGSKKTFKLDKPKKTTRKASNTTKKAASKTLAPTMWSELNEKIGSDGAVSYSFKTTYETNQVIEYAQDKLQRKGLDMIIANDVSRTDIGFNQRKVFF